MRRMGAALPPLIPNPLTPKMLTMNMDRRARGQVLWRLSGDKKIPRRVLRGEGCEGDR